MSNLVDLANANAWYPKDGDSQPGYVRTDQTGKAMPSACLAHLQLSAAEAVVADVDGVLAAVTDTGSAQTISTGFTAPPYPRNITATSGGTAGDIDAVQVVVTGTNVNDEVITETLPVFTADSATTVVGSKIFKTVTSVVLPAHAGTGATTSIGFGDKCQIPHKLARNSVLGACLNGVRETTFPTIAYSSSAIESNSFDLNSALNGTVVDLNYLVS